MTTARELKKGTSLQLSESDNDDKKHVCSRQKPCQNIPYQGTLSQILELDKDYRNYFRHKNKIYHAIHHQEEKESRQVQLLRYII